jgi:NAD(P)-dependent dehydrogenase (short-subunit alcohol dehydrogenase family)
MTDPVAAQRLAGKVAVVTGGTQGLGAAIARRAAAPGAAGSVELWDRLFAAMITGSVMDFDLTAHGPRGEHVRPTPAEVTA